MPNGSPDGDRSTAASTTAPPSNDGAVNPRTAAATAPIVDVAEAVRSIGAGGVVAYPTEAVFGIGCDPSSVDALRRVLAIRGDRLAPMILGPVRVVRRNQMIQGEGTHAGLGRGAGRVVRERVRSHPVRPEPVIAVADALEQRRQCRLQHRLVHEKIRVAGELDERR